MQDDRHNIIPNYNNDGNSQLNGIEAATGELYNCDINVDETTREE